MYLLSTPESHHLFDPRSCFHFPKLSVIRETRVFDNIGIATKKSKKTWEYLGVVVITTVNLHLLKPELSFKMVRTTS